MTEDIEFGSGNAECGKKAKGKRQRAKGMGHRDKDRGQKKDDRRQRILNSEVGMRNAERLEFGSGTRRRPMEQDYGAAGMRNSGVEN